MGYLFSLCRPLNLSISLFSSRNYGCFGEASKASMYILKKNYSLIKRNEIWHSLYILKDNKIPKI